MHWWSSSVCPSVPYMTLSREWKGIGSWHLARRKPMTRGDPWPHLEVTGQGHQLLNAISLEPEGLRTSNLVYDGVRWPTSPTCVVTSKVKVTEAAVDGCSRHHLQGARHIVAAPLQAAQLVFAIPLASLTDFNNGERIVKIGCNKQKWHRFFLTQLSLIWCRYQL